MGGKRFEVEMDLNASEFTRGAKDAEKAVGKLEDALDDAGAGGARDAGKIEDSFKDVQSQAKRTERSVEDVGDAGVLGLRKLGDKGAEASNELRQNLGETFSSFRGDLKDLPQIAQDTLGGLVSAGGFGMAAAAAGAAAGLGLFVDALDTADADAAAMRQRASDMARAFIAAGTNLLNASTIAAASAAALLNNDSHAEIRRYASALGVDMGTAARAYVGDANTLVVLEKLVAEAQASGLTLQAQQREGMSVLSIAKQEQLIRNQALVGAQAQLQGVVDEANEIYAVHQAVLRGIIRDSAGATVEVDSVGNVVHSLAGGGKIMVSAETGQATTDLSKFRGDLDRIANSVKSPVIRVGVDGSGWDDFTPTIRVGRSLGMALD